MAFIDDIAPILCPDDFFLCPSSLRTLLIKSTIGCAPLRLALTIPPPHSSTLPPTLPKSLVVTALRVLERLCDASPCAMDNSNPPLSFSPSKRRCEESDHPGQSASRSDSVASSQRTVSTVADSTNQSSSPSRHLTELRTVQPSVSATTTKRFPGNMPHNTWLEYSVAQTQTPQISRSNTNADESPSPVQQPSDHGSSEISAGVLTKTPLKRRVLLYGDILFSLTPLFFLGEYLKTPLAPPMLTKGVLASLSLYLNHQSKSTFGDKVKTTTSLSPTIFPIVYAAIVGTVLRRIGLYKAERSATVGVSV